MALKAVLKRQLLLIVLVVFALNLTLAYRGYPGLSGFAYISAGLCFCLVVWRSGGLGLPLVPVLATQHFLVYALPIFNRNATLLDYPLALIDEAGFEVFVFLLAMGSSWYVGMQMLTPSRGPSHVIVAFERDSMGALRKVGIGLMVGSTAYAVVDFLRAADFVFAIMPSGLQSIVTATVSAASLAGFFLVSMIAGARGSSTTMKALLAVSLAVNMGVALTSLLLYTVFGLVCAVSLGIFWSAGRIPWKLLIAGVAVLGFLQIGKTDMRELYHFSGDEDQGFETRPTTLSSLPKFYGDWFSLSLNDIGDSRSSKENEVRPKHATLGDRIDNLQNLLYVVRSVEVERVPPLEGRTYTIIPALLAPRIIWPEKPRTHEGQVMLNVYYGRQTMEESLGTYIAWGLLPEAFGNFGPLFGALFLGAVLGLFSAWVESYTALKPLLSIEGMCAFGMLLGMATSFEMVASVLVTSQFQAFMVTCMACLPFSRSLPLARRPDAEMAQSEL